MASTGFQAFGAVAVYSSGDGSWSNTSNILSNDANYTDAGYTGDLSDKLVLDQIGLTTTEVPAGSTIDGIEIKITKYSSDDNVASEHYYQLTDAAGVPQGNAKSPTAPQYSWQSETLGGAADTWGATLTAAMMIDADFGVVVWSDHVGSWEKAYISLVEINIHYTEGNDDVDVSAAAEALTITEYAATISVAFGVAAAATALTVTPLAATIANDVGVSVAAGALTVTTQAASLVSDVAVAGAAEALVLTPHSAAVGLVSGVSALLEQLTLTTYGATIGQDINFVTGAPPALTLTEYAATITAANVVDGAVEALTLTPQTASITLDVGVAAAAEALVVTPQAAAVDLAFGVPANAEALTITTQAATVAYNPNINAALESLVLTPIAATVLKNVISTARGVDPFISEISWNQVVVPQSDNLAEPLVSGRNRVTVSPTDDNEVEV